MMRKIGAGLLCLFAICLSACGGTPSDGAQKEEQPSVQDVYDALMEVNAIANPREIDGFALENTFAIDPEELVEEYAGTVSNTMSDSGLNLVIRAKEGKAEEVKTALETYKTSQETFFGGYYAEFADALSQIADGRVEAHGDLVVLVFANTEGAEYSEIDGVLSDIAK